MEFDELAEIRYSEKVRTFRGRLYSAAKADPRRKFYSLRDKVFRRDVLNDAWRGVKANKGAPGVDGQEIEAVVSSGEEEFLEQIYQELKEGTYRASSVRRVFIPKPDGGKRPLGIPTVKDRVVQGAVKIVIEMIFEADFKDFSYGYRPGRSCDDARQAIRKWLNFGCTTVIDADIKGFFDNILHEELMKEVERRVTDRWVLRLIKGWLRAKIVDPKTNHSWKPKKGTPQGGVISPLLANIYLNRLDREWEESGMSDRDGQDAKLVRYADDLVICTSGLACIPYHKLGGILEGLGLELHPEKTRLADVEKGGFDFLNFHFVRRWSRKHGKMVTYVSPSHTYMQRARQRVRKLTNKKRHSWIKPKELVVQVNRYLIGWANYVRHCNAYRAFRRLQQYVDNRVRKYLRYRRQRKGFGFKEYPDSFLHKVLGLYNLKDGGIISYV